MESNKGMSLMGRQKVIGFIFTLPFLIGFVIFFIAPFLISIKYTFTFGVDGRFVGMQNYVEVFSSDAFTLAAKNTFKFMLVGIPIIMLLSTLLAILLQYKFKGSSLFRSLFIFPLVVPIASTVMVFQLIFHQYGLINTILNNIGMKGENWIQSEHAFAILIGLYIWKNCGYNMVLIIAGLNSIPQNYYEAAQVEGANRMNRFRYITFPLMLPSFFFVLIISIINSFKCFREAFLLGGRLPNQSVYMLQHFMNNNFDNLNYQRLSVAAIAIFLVIFALLYVLFMLKKRKEDY